MTFSLHDLEAAIAQRASSTAERSYTKSLLDSGPARTAQKFGEEAVELVVAAALGERVAIASEAADTLYHLLVLLRSREIQLDEVLEELERRSGTSGHAEKAARASISPVETSIRSQQR